MERMKAWMWLVIETVAMRPGNHLVGMWMETETEKKKVEKLTGNWKETYLAGMWMENAMGHGMVAM
jgi:hypothetical protein